MRRYRPQGLVERGCLSQVIMIMVGIVAFAILWR